MSRGPCPASCSGVILGSTYSDNGLSRSFGQVRHMPAQEGRRPLIGHSSPKFGQFICFLTDNGSFTRGKHTERMFSLHLGLSACQARLRVSDRIPSPLQYHLEADGTVGGPKAVKPNTVHSHPRRHSDHSGKGGNRRKRHSALLSLLGSRSAVSSTDCRLLHGYTEYRCLLAVHTLAVYPLFLIQYLQANRRPEVTH